MTTSVDWLGITHDHEVEDREAEAARQRDVDSAQRRAAQFRADKAERAMERRRSRNLARSLADGAIVKRKPARRASTSTTRSKSSGAAVKAVAPEAAPVITAAKVARTARQAATRRLPNPGIAPGGRGPKKVVWALGAFALVVVLGGQLTGQYFSWDLKASAPPHPPAPPNYVPLYPGQQLSSDRPASGQPSAIAGAQPLLPAPVGAVG